MPVHNKRLLALLIGCLFTVGSFSQTSWSLDQCIAYALEHNIQLKQQVLTVNQAQNTVLRSQLKPIPDLNGGVGQTFRFGRSVDPLTYNFTTDNTKGSYFYARSQLDLFKGFEGYRTIQKTRLDLSKSLEDLKWAKNDLTLTITRYFLQVMFNQDLADVATNQLDISRQQLKQTQLLVNAGSLPTGDLLEIQAQLANDELNLVNAQNQLDMSLLDLAQLLDIENPESFLIVRPGFKDVDLQAQPENPQTIFHYALSTLPRIKSAEFAVQSSELKLKMTKSLLSPRLSMITSYGTGYSDQILDVLTGNVMPFSNQIQFASTSSISFHLEIPIFNNWATRLDIKDARLAVLNSNYEFELAQNKLRKEIQQAALDARSAMKRYQASKKTVVSLEESFRYSKEKFNLGILTSLEYVTAKNKLTKARSEMLQSKYNYIFNSKILDFYKGIPLD
ncbi:MAG: TolC family protein [Bacteroidales bacterium]|nr:TolC family protein [Bacteroidales bacterium]